jgi:deoxyuridine 5'-triphosphate nucleotidohydrolase
MAFCENFFEKIDTPEKAYILGIVAFNNISDAKDTQETSEKGTDISVYIEINSDEKQGDQSYRPQCVLYDYYLELSDEDKKDYPYFNNIDAFVGCLRKIGNVSIEADVVDMRSVLELTITSQKIKDDIASHLNITGCRYNDLSPFITKCYDADANVCNQFVKAYIERVACIRNDILNVSFYNDATSDCIVKLYDIPYVRNQTLKYHVIQYSSVNMIDLLGMIYSDYSCPYYNNYIYGYNNCDSRCVDCSSNGNGRSGGSVSIPIIKVLKVDDNAVMPTKTRYSDAGYDLTIIREHKRLTPDTTLYDTGIQLEIPNGYYVEIVPRSSISRSGYILANSVGIIDQGYRGNLYIALTKINESSPDLLSDLTLPWRCCQMIVRKQVYSRLVAVKEVEKSSRGTGAFGSTGGAIGSSV